MVDPEFNAEARAHNHYTLPSHFLPSIPTLWSLGPKTPVNFPAGLASGGGVGSVGQRSTWGQVEAGPHTVLLLAPWTSLGAPKLAATWGRQVSLALPLIQVCGEQRLARGPSPAWQLTFFWTVSYPDFVSDNIFICNLAGFKGSCLVFEQSWLLIC